MLFLMASDGVEGMGTEPMTLVTLLHCYTRTFLLLIDMIDRIYHDKYVH